MAIVLGGYTILQLLSMAASAGSFGASVAKIAEDLKGKGHPVDKPIPVDAQLAVQKAFDQMPQPLPADFGALASAERASIAAALEAVRSIYIENATIDGYRAAALKALYDLDMYIDLHS